MHWIVQLGLEAGHAEEAMLDTLIELGLPHTCINVVPFSHELQPDPGEPEGKVTVYGGTVLRRIAATRSWTPGYYFDDETFRFEAWYKHWGEHLLNSDSVVCRFEDVPIQFDRFFMRPCSSIKIFNATHLDWDDYQEWLEEVRNGDVSQYYQNLTLDTLVAVASYKMEDIYQECRFFVADKKIITGSFYRLSVTESFNTVSSRVPFFDSPWYDSDMERFVKDRVAKWQPYCAFVLDIATTSMGYKIIEVNSVSSSGLYECDVKKIVLVLEKMEADG